MKEGKTDALLSDVLAMIEPTEQDRKEILRESQFAISRLKKVVPHGVEIGLMGSTAKGTALRANREIDVFLLIPKKYPHDKMTKMGLEWAKRAMRGQKTEIGYANHPYLKVYRNGVKIDIVPSYKIENAEHLGSAVDRSQLHTEYVNSRMDEAQKGQVMLLKQFAKSLGVYGAELKIEGFSGYLCELLVLKYGTFLGVLQEAAKWGEKPVIDIEGHHAKNDLRAVFDSPLIVIDPVDKKRNVAAVVARTSVARFVFASRKFLEKPSKEFFFKEKEVHSPKKLGKLIAMRKTHTLALFFRPPAVVEDILWPQMRKTAMLLARRLENEEFTVFGQYYWSDGERGVVFFELVQSRLPGVRKRIGPAIWHGKDVDAFAKKHADAANLHMEHGRIVAIAKREHITPEETVKEAIALGERIGIPKGFANAMKKGRFGGIGELLKKPYLEAASDYFSRHL